MITGPFEPLVPAWTEERLLQIIASRTQENLSLEYKASAALVSTEHNKTQVSKDVSAFANSAGGTIIYGVAEHGHLPTAIDGGVNPNDIPREWLEQVVNTRIQPRIEGVRILPIDLISSNPGRVAYAVEIPASARAPHMASDHRYYKRFNFQSVPMEDYEVRDVSRRLTGPDLAGWLTIGTAMSLKLVYDANVGTSHAIPIRVNVRNDSVVPCEYGVFRVHLPRELNLMASHPFTVEDTEVNLMVGGQSVPTTTAVCKHSIPAHMPIFQGVQFHLGDLMIRVPRSDSQYPMAVEAVAPYMSPRSRIQSLVVTDDTAILMP